MEGTRMTHMIRRRWVALLLVLGALLAVAYGATPRATATTTPIVDRSSFRVDHCCNSYLDNTRQNQRRTSQWWDIRANWCFTTYYQAYKGLFMKNSITATGTYAFLAKVINYDLTEQYFNSGWQYLSPGESYTHLPGSLILDNQFEHMRVQFFKDLDGTGPQDPIWIGSLVPFDPDQRGELTKQADVTGC